MRVDQVTEGAVRTQVDGEPVGPRRDHPVHGRARPAAGGVLAHLGDHAERLQPGDHLGGGGFGQAGQLADPGPGQRPVVDEQPQHGAVVDGTEQTGSARHHRLDHGHPPLPLVGKFPNSVRSAWI